MISTAAPRSTTQRKRQRLDQLVDRIALLVSTTPNASSSVNDDPVTDVMDMSRLRQAQRSALRRPVFSFDHVLNNNNNNQSDRNKKLRDSRDSRDSREESDDEEDEEDCVFSPVGASHFCDQLTLSPCSVDSPGGISFSPLSFDDEQHQLHQLRAPDASTPLNLSKSSRNVTSASPYALEWSNRRRRARSDPDLRSSDSDATHTEQRSSSHLNRLEHLRPPPLQVSVTKRNSSDSDSWSPLFHASLLRHSQRWQRWQESPVDLSIRSGSSSDSPSSLSQYLSAEYASSDDSFLRSPLRTVVAPAPLVTSTLIRNTSAAFSCEICGQGFDVHDRLVKHLASRHKTVTATAADAVTAAPPATVVKGYQCEVCQRPFARSDMLTRHMRLHTGLKPYTCRTCGQVFSRSDHLSTHQRTHTGEKPYRCPQCAYAACRRDMITRHLRTHARSEDLSDKVSSAI